MKFFIGIAAAIAVGAVIVAYSCVKAASQEEKRFYTPMSEIWVYGSKDVLRKRVAGTLADNGIIIQEDADNDVVNMKFLYMRNDKVINATTYEFLKKLYSDKVDSCYITLHEVWWFAEEFNTSIDYLLGRTDRETM